MDSKGGLVGRLTLRARLVSVVLLLFLISVIGTEWTSARLERAALEEVQTHVETLFKAIEVSLQQLPSRGKSAEEVLRDYQSRLQNSGVRSITIYDQDRHEIATSSASQLSRSSASIASSDELYTYELTLPVVANENLLGYIHLQLVLDNFRALFREMTVSRILLSMAIFGVGILIVLPLTSYVTRPINGLSAVARAITEGNLDIEVPEASSPDLQPLTTSFSRMIAQLRKQKELEALLAEKEKGAALGQMASGIAHDIRNPINFVALALEHLAGQPASSREDDQTRNLLTDAHGELMRVNRMVQDFLDFGRAPQLRLVPSNLSRILMCARSDFIRRHGSEEPRVEIAGTEANWVAQADPDLLLRVLSNLLENAWEAGGPDKVIKLGIAEDTTDKSQVVAWVEDGGPGIAPEDLPRIFTPYFTTKSSGVGLGLALAKKSVEQMNGQILARNLDHGARFEVRFARAASTSEAEPPAPLSEGAVDPVQ